MNVRVKYWNPSFCYQVGFCQIWSLTLTADWRVPTTKCTALLIVLSWRMCTVHTQHCQIEMHNKQQCNVQLNIYIYGFQCCQVRLLGFAGIIISILMPLLVYLWNSPHNFEAKFIEDYDLQMWIQILWCPVNAVFLTFQLQFLQITSCTFGKLVTVPICCQFLLYNFNETTFIKSQTNIMDLGQKYPILGMQVCAL